MPLTGLPLNKRSAYSVCIMLNTAVQGQVIYQHRHEPLQQAVRPWEVSSNEQVRSKVLYCLASILKLAMGVAIRRTAQATGTRTLWRSTFGCNQRDVDRTSQVSNAAMATTV